MGGRHKVSPQGTGGAPWPSRPQDKWRKAFIAEVVAHLLDKYPRLDASKNPATAMPTDAKGRKVPENACAIVAEGLRRAGIQVTDKAVAGQLGPL